MSRRKDEFHESLTFQTLNKTGTRRTCPSDWSGEASGACRRAPSPSNLRPPTPSYALGIGILAKAALALAAICSLLRSCLCVANDQMWPKGSSN